MAAGVHESAGEARTDQQVFCKEGEYWTIVYAGTVAHLRSTKGLHYLANLLRNPGARIAAVELQADGNTPAAAAPSVTAEPDDASQERARLAVTKAIKGTLRRIETAHPALWHHLNVTVRCGYRCAYLPDPHRPVTWER